MTSLSLDALRPANLRVDPTPAEVAYLARALLSPEQVHRFIAPRLTPPAALLADLIFAEPELVDAGQPLLDIAMLRLPVTRAAIAALPIAEWVDGLTAELRSVGSVQLIAIALGARPRPVAKPSSTRRAAWERQLATAGGAAV